MMFRASLWGEETGKHMSYHPSLALIIDLMDLINYFNRKKLRINFQIILMKNVIEKSFSYPY